MKLSINLLPLEPENEEVKKKKRLASLLSGGVLLVFLLVTLVIFGLFLFLTKNTQDTREAIKREEARIDSLALSEKLYRTLSLKLSFLAEVWQKRIEAAEVVKFAQTLLVEGARLTQISLEDGELTTLALEADSSETLEIFLNGLEQAEKDGQIKEAKVSSTTRNKDGGYEFNSSFKFLK